MVRQGIIPAFCCCPSGDAVRDKTETAQINEALCKVLAHNLCCLIQSIYELGIEATFGSEMAVAS